MSWDKNRHYVICTSTILMALVASFKNSLSEDQIHGVVTHIRSLVAKK
jgi:hypothetical protein